MADKYYTDGYGTKRPIKIPFWESAKGQQVKKAGEIVGEAGAFALGTLLPFSRLKMIPKILGGIGIADFATSDRASELPRDIKEGNYGKAALTGAEGILTALAVAEGVKKLPGIRKSAENIAKNGLSKNNTIVHRAIVMPKGSSKPDLYRARTGENVYEIPETQKYVGSYDTAISSIEPKNLNRTVVEHYKVPKKKVNMLEYDEYPDGQIDMVASISNDILPTRYSIVNPKHPYKIPEDIINDIPMYNWERVSKNLSNIIGGTTGTAATLAVSKEKGSR